MLTSESRLCLAAAVCHRLYVGAFLSRCFPICSKCFSRLLLRLLRQTPPPRWCFISQGLSVKSWHFKGFAFGFSAISVWSLCRSGGKHPSETQLQQVFSSQLVSQSPSEGERHITSHPPRSETTFIPGSHLKITLYFLVSWQFYWEFSLWDPIKQWQKALKVHATVCLCCY